MRPGVVLGWARIGVFFGIGGVVAGLAVTVYPVAWGGAAVVAVATGANVVAKLAHFDELPLTPERRTRLAATWVFLATGVVALLAHLVARRSLAGYGDVGLFWPLLVVVVVLTGVYRYFQSRYLDEEMAEAA